MTTPRPVSPINVTTDGECPGTPTGNNHHRRKSSVALSPAWADKKVVEISGFGSMKPEDLDKAAMAFFPLDTPSQVAAGTEESPVNLHHRKSSISKTEEAKDSNDDNMLSKLNKKSVIFGSFRKSKTGDDEKKETASTDSLGSDDDSEGSSINSDDMKDLATVFWEDVPEAPADAILGIAQAYRMCENPKKVNVCVGAYRDENGKPWVLPSVRQAERMLLDQNDIKEYLPIEGDREFVELAMRFAYGQDMAMDHLAAVQTLSGTGACRVGGSFVQRFWPGHPIYVPTPTWGNHISIFKECGLDVRKYRYYNRATNGLDFHGMIRDINKAPKGSVILLHACAHNPTGCDPTIDQWKKIISIISQKEHVAFFDSAYQGFASGDAERDAQPFRYAVAHHVPIILAQSFAKNFGLYGERCGTLSVVCGDLHQKEHILSELRTIIRPMYSSPPRHGSSIVKTILNDPVLKPQYYQECHSMSNRIQKMRVKLVEKLGEVGSKHNWDHILKQIGMFAFTGLDQEMSLQLTDEHAIFLTTNGRISIAGLNDHNVEYVAQCIHLVSDGKSITA